MTRIHRAILIVALLLPAAVNRGWTDEVPTKTQARPVDQNPDIPRQPDPKEIHALRQALTQAVTEGWQDFHLQTRCPGPDDLDSLEVFGNGVGVWNMESQIRLPAATIRRMLSTLLAADFAAMPTSFGGKARPLTESPRMPPAGAEIACQISLDLDEVSKTVIQMRKGEQSTELQNLAGSLLDLARPYVDKGVTPNGLEDSLAKVANGELAPELLSLSVHRKPMGGQEGDGWLLVIRLGVVEVRSVSAKSDHEPPHRMELGAEQIRALAAFLNQKGLAAMPVNLWARIYTDLDAGVMRWRKSIQARQFDGMQPGDLGDRQEAFDALIAELESLRNRAIQEGSSPPPSPSPQ